MQVVQQQQHGVKKEALDTGPEKLVPPKESVRPLWYSTRVMQVNNQRYLLLTSLISLKFSGIGLITLDAQKYEEVWPKKRSKEKGEERKQREQNTQKVQKQRKDKKNKEEKSCPRSQNNLLITKETQQV